MKSAQHTSSFGESSLSAEKKQTDALYMRPVCLSYMLFCQGEPFSHSCNPQPIRRRRPFSQAEIAVDYAFASEKNEPVILSRIHSVCFMGSLSMFPVPNVALAFAGDARFSVSMQFLTITIHSINPPENMWRIKCQKSPVRMPSFRRTKRRCAHSS